MILNGRYQVKERIGDGGMALVYRATDLRLNRDVAVKMLRPQYAGDADFVQRFNQEATSAAQLAHPNIAQVFDTGRDGETRYIVMELLKPFTLKNRIAHAPGGRLAPEDAIAVAIEIARALGHAHTHGVVHRDIKPQNILFTDDGHVKVTDFGIARALAASGGTATGTILGSPHYLSPEQAQGLPAGPPSDLYSLGVVLYEMLTGRPPYTGETPVAIAVQHVHGDSPSVRGLAPSVPVGLEQVVQRAMLRDPQQRFATATEFAAALEAARGGRLTSLPPAPADALATQMMRGTSLAAAVAPLPVDRPTVPRELERAQSGSGNWVVVGAALIAIALLAGAYFGTHKGAAPVVPPPVTKPAGPVKRQIAIDDLTGKKIADARAELLGRYSADGAVPPQLVEMGRVDGPEPEGTIVEQQPKAGTMIDEGGVIQVKISSGVEPFDMPDVSNMTLDQAKEALGAKGVRQIEVKKETKDDVEPGLVIGQQPGPGTKARRDKPVRLTVSQHKPAATPKAATPDVRHSPIVTNDAGERETSITVAIPAGAAEADVSLRWTKGGDGGLGGAVIAGGKESTFQVRGKEGATVGVFVNGKLVQELPL